MDMREIIINEIMIPSLQKLYKVDYDNIRLDVSERNICARLAHHMENEMRRYDRDNERKLFRKYYADVEYNRMGNGDIKQYENSKHLPKKMVSDLLIQSRGEEPNFLAVEMKKKKNDLNRVEDRQRLKALVSPVPVERKLPCVYGTLVGAFIIFSSEDVVIELYWNDEGKGKKTGEITLQYDKEEGLRKKSGRKKRRKCVSA